MVVVVIVLHFDPTELESVTPKYFLGQGKKRTQTLFLKEPLLGSTQRAEAEQLLWFKALETLVHDHLAL